jgi:hypothetical protein
MSYLCKVSVCPLLSVYRLLWRGLPDEKDQLSKAMGAKKTGTPAGEQQKAGKTDKKKMSKIHAWVKSTGPLEKHDKC